MANKLESLKRDLRVLLSIEKNGILIDQLKREYRQVTGSKIEYDRKQHQSLEAFLLSLPDIVKITKRNGQTICEGVGNKEDKEDKENQEGIRRLIRQQQNKAKKRTVVRPTSQSHDYQRPTSNRPVYATRLAHNSSFPNAGGAAISVNAVHSPAIIDKEHGKLFDVRARTGKINVVTYKPAEPKQPQPEQANANRCDEASNASIQNEPTEATEETSNRLNGENLPVEKEQSTENLPVEKNTENPPEEKNTENPQEEKSTENPPEEKNTENPPEENEQDGESLPEKKQDAENQPDENTENAPEKKQDAENRPKEKQNIENGRRRRLPTSQLVFEIRYDEPADYKLELSQYAIEHGLPEPHYVTSVHVEKGQVIAYFSKVQIGKRSWLVFPVSYRTSEGADNGAARKALKDLRREQRFADKQKMRRVPTSIGDDMLRELVKLIDDQSLFTDAVEDEFLAKYGLKLESNWLDLVQNSKIFDVQEIWAGEQLLTTISLSTAYLKGELSLDSISDTNSDSNSEANSNSDSNSEANSDTNSETNCETNSEVSETNSEVNETISEVSEPTTCDPATDKHNVSEYSDWLTDTESGTLAPTNDQHDQSEYSNLSDHTPSFDSQESHPEDEDSDVHIVGGHSLNASKRSGCSDDSQSTIGRLIELIRDQSLHSFAVESEFQAKFGYELESNWLELAESSKLFNIQKIQTAKKLAVIVEVYQTYPDAASAKAPANDLYKRSESECSDWLTDTTNATSTINTSDDLDTSLSEPSEQSDQTDEQSHQTDEQSHQTDEQNHQIDEQSHQIDEQNHQTDEQSHPTDQTSSNDAEYHPNYLPLDLDKDWKVMVVSVGSEGELRLRMVKHQDKLDELTAELNRFYNEEKQGKPVQDLAMNKHYAAVYEGAAFRVEALIQIDDKITCSFVDDGPFERVDRSDLRVLDKRFLRLPFQAFSAKLDGVHLNGAEYTLFRKFFEERLKAADGGLCLIARPTCYEPITVRLYDTSGSDDIDVNRELLDYIAASRSSHFRSIRPSELPGLLNSQIRLEATSVENDFLIGSVSLYASEYARLQKELERIYSIYSFDDRIALNDAKICPGMFVAVKDEDDKWYRGRIEKRLSKDTSERSCPNPIFSVMLIDVGRTVTVKLHDIQPLFDQFFELPIRVSRASLNLIPISDSYSIDAIFCCKHWMDKQQFNGHDCLKIDEDSYVLLNLKNVEGRCLKPELVNHAKPCA